MQKFGKIIITKIMDNRNCEGQCDCGNIKNFNIYKLKIGHTKSCGCLKKSHRFKDIFNKKYGKLTPINFIKKGIKSFWKCKCDCGNEVTVSRNNLISKHTRSCGCEKKFGHGYEEKTKRRLLNKILLQDDCHIWTGSKYHHGYGCTSYKGKKIQAHRLIYMLYKGQITEGMYVCHSCDNPSCINPDHLWLGTQKDNMTDMIEKGRKVNRR